MQTSASPSVLKTVAIFFWELVKVFLLAMAIILPIRYFLIQPFFVRGASMEPNFHDGEYLVIDELSYRFREPARGEVIVFHFPGGPTQYFIKRIIGLPGETVIVENGRVIIQNRDHPGGVVLDETDYLPDVIRTTGQVRLTLKDTEYFVLGDNRPASSDSRAWGVLPKRAVVGRVWLRAFPFDKLGFLTFGQPSFINL